VGAAGAGGGGAGGDQGHQSRFLVPLSECEFQLSAVLEELARDSFAALPDCRPARYKTLVPKLSTLNPKRQNLNLRTLSPKTHDPKP
jgi:hypothetical protein